jgi:hypothetical protein
MLVTVENQLAVAINVPAVAEDGVAVGGGNHPEETTHRTNPLPYPFAHVGELEANGGADSIQLPMHPSDWRYGEGGQRSQMARGLPVRVRWQQLVQAGTVTLAVAAQANRREEEELFLNLV